jgi:hypothetical protein
VNIIEAKAEHDQARPEPGTGGQFRVRLPRFVADEEIGLGDAIKRVTSRVGIQPCGGCAHRAAILNRWVGFSGRRPR